MKNRTVSVSKIALLSVLNVLFLAAIATAVGPRKKGALEITRVGLDKKSFNPSKGEKVSLGFEINNQADVQVSFYDRLGRKVRSLDLQDAQPGRRSATWDGRGSDANLPAGSVFLYVIEAETKNGAKAIHNPAPKTGGHEVKTLEYTLNRKTGELEFVLPNTCMVRIRAGLTHGIFANTLIDWEPYTAGRHSYEWDGRDSSGFMNILKHRDLDVRLSCYTLPSNTVIVTGKTVPFKSGNNPLGPENKERDSLWATKGKYMHYVHDPRMCHEARFKVAFPTATRTEGPEEPVVSGVVPIRVELDERDVWHLINTKFEVMLFIDGVFVYEIEEGSSPFTFNWDTKAFAKGPHILTVNLIVYDDHVGIVSRKVIIGD